MEKVILCKWKRCDQGVETWAADAWSSGIICVLAALKWVCFSSVSLLFLIRAVATFSFCHSPPYVFWLSLLSSCHFSPAVFGVNRGRTWLLNCQPFRGHLLYNPYVLVICASVCFHHQSYLEAFFYILLWPQSHLRFHKWTSEVIMRQKFRHDSGIWQKSKKRLEVLSGLAENHRRANSRTHMWFSACPHMAAPALREQLIKVHISIH